MHSPRRTLALLLAGLFAASLGSLAAQERFSDAIAVSEVQVPVRVLRKGTPVAGLTLEDFEIYDRGVRQRITAFEVRQLGTGPGRTPAVDARGSSEIAAGRSLLVLFDFGFSRRRHLAQGLEGVRTMISSQLAPSDRVAVATWGVTSGLNLLVGFTAERNQLELALDAVQAMLDAKRAPQQEALDALHEARFGSPSADSASAISTGSGSTYATLAAELGPTAALSLLSGPVEYDEVADRGLQIREQDSRFGPIKLRVEVDVVEPIDIAQDTVVDPTDTDVRLLGLSLAELASLLRDLGGGKDMLLLSEGFRGPALRDARSLFFLEKAIRALRDGGWTLNAIDVGGIPNIDERSFDASSLHFISDATGGELVENIRDLSQATARALARTELVYVLSFQPSAPPEAEGINKLEVRLASKQRGVKLHHRPGYYGPRAHWQRDTYEQRVDVASWLLTNLEATEIETEVFAHPVSDPGGGSRLEVAIDVTTQGLVVAGRRERSTLEVWLAVLDPDDRVRDLQTASIELDPRHLSSDPAGRGLRFTADLPPGDYRFRVLARSSRGGEVFLASYDLGSVAASPPATGWRSVALERRTRFFR